MTIDEMIAVLQAAKAGKQIECRRYDGKGWYPKHTEEWHFHLYDYRVKPEPREWMVPPHILSAYALNRDWAESSKCVKVREVL